MILLNVDLVRMHGMIIAIARELDQPRGNPFENVYLDVNFGKFINKYIFVFQLNLFTVSRKFSDLTLRGS